MKRGKCTHCELWVYFDGQTWRQDQPSKDGEQGSARCTVAGMYGHDIYGRDPEPLLPAVDHA